LILGILIGGGSPVVSRLKGVFGGER